MTSGAPWSVKGIDPKAREIAKDLAHRSGMTLGEWINQMIFDDGSKSDESEDSPRPAPTAAAVRPATESRPPRRGGDDLDRVLAAIEDLSSRLEASERQQIATSARFDTALTELRADQAKVAEKLQAAPAAGAGAAANPGRNETLRSLEAALSKVAGHLQDGESRGREALSVLRREMKQELQGVADQMGQKVQDVENRSADAIAQVGAEVTRVASVVEQRLRRADDAQAEALEKLGAEIARITERLSERIAAAERRSAQAIDDVGEQMARVTDRIHQRQERTSSELADRMRQSEERTAKILEEAREKIERQVSKRFGVEPLQDEAPAASGTLPWSGSTAGPPPPATAYTPPAEPAFLEPPALAPPLAAETVVEDERPSLAETYAAPSISGPAPTLTSVQDFDPYLVEAQPEFHEHVVAAPVDLEAIDLDEDEPVETVEEGGEAQGGLRPSTRDLIAAARAAARLNNGEESPYEAAAFAEPGEPEVLFTGMIQRKPRMSGAMRGILLTGGVAASIGLAATGYLVIHPEMLPTLSGFGGRAKVADGEKPIPVGPASTSTATATPAPQQALTLTTPSAKPADEASDAEALFRDATAKVDSGDASGVAPLRTAANLGYAPAQRRLGKLYEDGGAGVTKDEVEGRHWTQRAAANGDARGMHNLGLDYYEGTGGPKNMVVAAQWFQRAAELGLRDSQYNLARFYESGLGVKQDLATAYKWYLIAGRAGDTEAAARGEALKSQLSPETRAGVEKTAMGFSPDPAAAPASMIAGLKSATRPQLALAQRALAKLGYYKGADDGVASQGLGEAIQAYQRDRGLAANGALSPELSQTFANVTR